MEKITSFTINHLKLLPGVYVSRKDKVGNTMITTFDLRMTRPNCEPVMNTAEIHTLEHLGATFLRNHEEWGDKIIYFGPMGCRTGFYFLQRGMSHQDAIILVRQALDFVIGFSGEIPGCSAIECGNYKEHDLAAAQEMVCALRERLNDYSVDLLQYETVR